MDCTTGTLGVGCPGNEEPFMTTEPVKKGRQIALRLDADTYARIKQLADRDGLKVANIVRRLSVWALPHCEELPSAFLLRELTASVPKVRTSRSGTLVKRRA